jgi:hypothetical protein
MQGDICPFTVKSKPRKRFTTEEDDLIRTLVGRCGDPHFAPWSEIARQVHGRTPRQVRERFQHYLSPHVAGGPWSHEEDDRLRRLHVQLGSNWAAIAAMMPGRANTAVKNRWNTVIRDKDISDPGEGQSTEATVFDFDEITFDCDGPSWFDEAAAPPDDPWAALL